MWNILRLSIAHSGLNNIHYCNVYLKLSSLFSFLITEYKPGN